MFSGNKGYYHWFYFLMVIIILTPFIISGYAFFKQGVVEIIFYKQATSIAFDSFMLAILATIGSLVFGFLFAYCLFITRFYGKFILVHCLNLNLILPIIVAVFALVASYGHTGLMTQLILFMLRKFEQITGIHYLVPQLIYNKTGVLLGFCFFNLPFATSVFLLLLQKIPQNYWRIASQYHFKWLGKCYYIIFPAIRVEVIQLFFFIFFSCFTSFTLLLILGGGKEHNLTTELYFALNDLNVDKIVALSSVHILISLIFIILLSFYKQDHMRSKTGCYQLSDIFYFNTKSLDIKNNKYAMAMIFILSLFIFSPIIMLITKININVMKQLISDQEFLRSLFVSLKIALYAAFFSSVIVVILSARKNNVLSLLASYASFIFPSFILLSGLLLICSGHMNLFEYRLSLSILLITIGLLPSVYRFSSATFYQQFQQQKTLCQLLNLKGFYWLYYLFMPLSGLLFLRNIIFSFALAFGEFSIFIFLGDSQFKPLSLLLYEYMGRYQFNRADQLAILLLIFYLFLFLLSSLLESLVFSSGRNYARN